MWRYFADPWNCFDFAIVAGCLLPAGGSSVAVLRLLRLLRVLRLLRALPKLQMLVGTLLKSIPSMAYVSLLLLLLFYIYGVSGVFFFGANDPVHFGDLGIALVSLFRVVTLEDWTDIMYIQMLGCAGYGYEGRLAEQCVAPLAQPLLSVVFFISFVLFGTMIFLNLFIGVIMNGMEEARAEQRSSGDAPALADAAALAPAELDELRRQLEQLRRTVANLTQLAAGAALAGADEPAGAREDPAQSKLSVR